MKPSVIPSPPRLHTRPPLERMMKIHQAIQAGNFPNATVLGRELEVSTKSIHRDIEFMRERMGMPIEYVVARHGYRYTEPVEAFPTLQITEGEFVALVVAEKALQQYRGTSFEKPLLSAIQKLQESMPDTFSLNFSDWEQTISFRTSAEPILNVEVLDALARATAKREQLTLTYRKPGSRITENRVIDPYHLANINGEWFLFAFDHLRKDIRTFVPARIHAAKPTGKTFARPQKFSLEKRLRDSFGVHSGEDSHDVRIRFTGFAADYIREKRWHPSQELRESKDGSVELRLTLSSLLEIQRWILGWGGNATVLQPPALVAAVQEAARKLLANYPR